MIEWLDVAVLVVAAAGSAFQVLSGIGFGLIASPLLILALGREDGIRIVLIISIVLNAVVLARSVRFVRLGDTVKLLIPAALLVVPAAGEATALRVGDVDFARGVIRVSRSLSPGMRGELIEQSPKSHKSRDVPLIDALRPYAEAAARGKRGSDLLFDGVDGGRLTNHNARRAVNWEELREAIGRPDLRIHDLRHTFATILFDAGATAPDVQATLGHSSPQVTERYSRAREGVALRAGAALNDALKRADETAEKSAAKRAAETAHLEPEMAQRRTRRTLNGTLMAQPHERRAGIAP